MKKYICLIFVSIVFVCLVVSGCGVSKDDTLSDVEIKLMATVEDAVATLLQSEVFADLPIEERVDQVVALLQKYNIDDINIDLDSGMISYVYPNGVLGGVKLMPFNGDTNGPEVDIMN